MTKLRPPESIEDAMRQAAALLGDDAISTALTAIGLRASPSLIAKWSDPDAPQVPSFAHVRAVEALLLKNGHAAIFIELLKGEQLAPVASAGDPVEGAVQATIDAAELLKGVRTAVQDGALQIHEVSALKARLQKLQRALADLNKSLVVKRR